MCHRILQGLYCTNFEKAVDVYIIIDILIFRVSMNGKGDKFQLGIKFLCEEAPRFTGEFFC
jgi:hypothetical protein